MSIRPMVDAAPKPRPLLATKKNQEKLSPLQSLAAGGIAGAIEASVTYPFEFAKTRSQLPGQATNPLRLLQHTVSTQGFSGVYTGCGALVSGTALKAGVRFLAFDTIRNALADERGRLSTLNGIFAGMLAGVSLTQLRRGRLPHYRSSRLKTNWCIESRLRRALSQ